MAITDKEQGVWSLDEVYNKINQGGIWSYTSQPGLYVWGRNSYQEGALGQNNTTDYSSPVQMGGDGWNSVANSTSGGIATKTDGTLWSWGYANSGALGLNQGGAVKISSPTQIGTGTDWAKAHFVDESISMATKTNGTLWSMGNNGRGAIGDNTNISRSSPTQCGTNTTWGNATINGGDGQVVALKSDGSLWSWGYGQSGVLGLNQSPGPTGSPKISSPTQVPGTWSHLGSGYYNTYAMKTDGTLWGWGANGYTTFQTGNNTSYSSPIQIGTDTDWGGPVAGYRYGVVAIKANGKLYGWGEQDNGDRAGCLGQNTIADVPAPTLIGTETTWHDITIATSGGVQGLKTDGTLWTWGGNLNGTLGLSTPVPSGALSSPTQLPGLWNA